MTSISFPLLFLGMRGLEKLSLSDHPSFMISKDPRVEPYVSYECSALFIENLHIGPSLFINKEI